MGSVARRPLHYLVTCAGIPNYGDELIAATWLRYLAAAAPGCDVVVDCIRPEAARASLGHLHPSVRFVNTLWLLCWSSRSVDPCDVTGFVAGAVADPARTPWLAADIEELATADVVHLVGGGYLNAIRPLRIGHVAGAAAAVRRSGGVAAMTGQGLLPQSGAAVPLLRKLAAEFAVVDVRDDASAELLGDSAVSRTGDDVFLGLGPGLFRRDGDLPEVMVCAQSDLGRVQPAQVAEFVVGTLRRWGVRGDQVGVVECCPKGDRDVSLIVARALPGARRYELHDLLANGFPAASGQRWITTRFHAHLAAAAAGASGIAVSVLPSCYLTKHGSLIAQGSGWRLIDGLAPAPEPEGGGFRSDVLARYRRVKRALADTIYASAAACLRPEPQTDQALHESPASRHTFA